MWLTSVGEVEALARSHGLALLRAVIIADQLSRADVSWTSMALRLPDDGAGALPLLRGNAGPDGLGFAGAGFRTLLAHQVSNRQPTSASRTRT